MGCSVSKESGVLPEDVVHGQHKHLTSSTSKEMMIQSKQQEDTVKYLLLGPGESGKSTIFKQMREL